MLHIDFWQTGLGEFKKQNVQQCLTINKGQLELRLEEECMSGRKVGVGG